MTTTTTSETVWAVVEMDGPSRGWVRAVAPTRAEAEEASYDVQGRTVLRAYRAAEVGDRVVYDGAQYTAGEREALGDAVPIADDGGVRYAAVVDDGMRRVVWGIGETQEEARRDAVARLQQYHDGHEDIEERLRRDLDGLTIHPITRAQVRRIEQGDISWPE